MSITIFAKIGVDTAENEPPKVSMKLGGTIQELHPASVTVTCGFCTVFGSDRGQERSMLESRGWNSGDDEEAMSKLVMSYKGEIMMAIDSVDSVDLSENERELMFKHISTIIKQDRIRVRPQNQKAA